MRRPVTLSRPSKPWNTHGRSGVDGHATGSSNAASNSRLISSSVYRCGLARVDRCGNRPSGGISVRLSVALR